MCKKQSFDDYRISEAFWQRLEPLLPTYTVSPQGGRPRANLRGVVEAIFYCLRTGCQWKAIPPQLAPGSTAHAYFQEWVEHGVFEALWALALEEYVCVTPACWDNASVLRIWSCAERYCKTALSQWKKPNLGAMRNSGTKIARTKNARTTLSKHPNAVRVVMARS